MQQMMGLYQERINLIPQGKRVVSEPERQRTLVDLLDAQTELITALEKFPVTSIHVKRSEVTEFEKLTLE